MRSESTHHYIAKQRAHIPFLHYKILEFDHNGGSYTSDDHDFTLRVPPGAIAVGEKIHFEVDLALYGRFNFPINTQPISPILWICLLERDIKLKKSFEIVLPHCLVQNKAKQHQISFAKANHNNCIIQKNQIMYQFELCEAEIQLSSSPDGDSNYGTLQTNHCCFYCIQANCEPPLAQDTTYCLAKISERNTESSVHTIWFATLFSLRTCTMALKEQYQPNGDYKFEFSDFNFKQDQDNLYIKIVPRKQIWWQEYDIAMEPTIAEV